MLPLLFPTTTAGVNPAAVEKKLSKNYLAATACSLIFLQLFFVDEEKTKLPLCFAMDTGRGVICISMSGLLLQLYRKLAIIDKAKHHMNLFLLIINRTIVLCY